MVFEDIMKLLVRLLTCISEGIKRCACSVPSPPHPPIATLSFPPCLMFSLFACSKLADRSTTHGDLPSGAEQLHGFSWTQPPQAIMPATAACSCKALSMCGLAFWDAKPKVVFSRRTSHNCGCNSRHQSSPCSNGGPTQAWQG